MKHETLEAADAPSVEPVAIEFTIDRDALNDALALLARVVERRNTIPILSTLLLQPNADGSAVAITGTDLDLQLTIELPCRWEGTGRACLDAHTLASAVKKAERGAELQFKEEAGSIILYHGRTRSRLVVTKADGFPVIAESKEGEEAAMFELPAAQLASDLARVAWAQGREETRYYLMGTALQFSAGEMIMAATEGHNLAFVTRPPPAGAEEAADIIIPRKAVDIIGRALKGRGEAPAIEASASRLVVRANGLTLITKLIDGSFPDWRKVLPADGVEMQIVGLPEAEARIPLSSVEMCRKALGAAPIVEMTDTMARLTLPSAPEFCAIAMLLREDEYLPKGYAYESGHDGGAKALGYLTEVAVKAGLPQFSHECEGYGADPKPFAIVDAHLLTEAGMVTGATFGQQTSRAGVGHEWVEEPDYDTLTMRKVRRDVRREDGWEDGSYSVAMPRERQGMAALVTMGTPGVDERALATKNGAILLDAAAIARLAGDPADWERVHIKPLTLHHGRILPEGWRLPEPMMTNHPKERGGKNRLRKMTDREVMNAYCEDPAGTMAALQPRPTVEAHQFADAIAEIAMRLSGWQDDAGTEDEPSAAIIPFPAELRAAQIAAEALSAETDAPAEPPGMAVEEAEEKVAGSEPRALKIAPAAPQRPDKAGWGDDVEFVGDSLATLCERIGRLEYLVEAVLLRPDEPQAGAFDEPDDAANSSGTQPEGQSDSAPAAHLSRNNNFTRERRLRIVRRYLAMRTQRDLDKRALMEGRGWVQDQLAELERLRGADQRAEDAEFKAADLAKRLEDAEAALAIEAARADSADARWTIALDEKQARIVALENEKIERLSGGRIKLTPPLRANAAQAVPLWNSAPAATGRMQ